MRVNKKTYYILIKDEHYAIDNKYFKKKKRAVKYAEKLVKEKRFENVDVYKAVCRGVDPR